VKLAKERSWAGAAQAASPLALAPPVRSLPSRAERRGSNSFVGGLRRSGL